MTDHVQRARQIADAIDSPNPELTLYEQFHAEWKAWEAEDPTRTMRDFDRAIGRSKDYTGKIVRGVTGPTRAPEWKSGSNKRDEVTAKTLTTADDDQVEKVLASLPPQAVERLVTKGTDRLVGDARARQAEHQTEPTVKDLMGDDPFNPAEHWADTVVIRVSRNARELASLIKRAGGLLYGSMTPEEAYEYLHEAEGLIAEARAAAQEQVRDEVQV